MVKKLPPERSPTRVARRSETSAKLGKKNEVDSKTIGQKIAVITFAVVVVAISAQYLYHHYYFLPRKIAWKSELPTVSARPDPVCPFCLLFCFFS